MKASIQTAVLQQHKKTLLTVKPGDRKLFSTAAVTLTVSDDFEVTGPGFHQKMECKPISEGSVSIPYRTWHRFLTNLKNLIAGREVLIAAENGLLQFGTLKITSDDIKVVRPNTTAMELPINPTPKMLVEFVLGNDAENVDNAGMREAAKGILETLSKQIREAADALKDYGITFVDVQRLVADKFGVKDYDAFVRLIEGCREPS